MPWEKSLVPVQATLGEAGLKKGIAGFNESQVDTGETNKKTPVTHTNMQVVHPINSVIIYSPPHLLSV